MADQSLLTPPPTDQSVNFFNEIFGAGWENILEGATSSGGAGGVLFEIFGIFNAVTLACVVALTVYIIMAGVAATAHEGETLGKRYSTLWTPIRIAFSVSLLMPLPWAKLSLLQAVALKCIFFSIGAADSIANTATDYMASHGGALAMPTAPYPAANKMAATMLYSLVVQEHLRERDGLAASGLIDISKPNAVGFFFEAPANFGLTEETMGRVVIPCDSKTIQLCRDKINAAKTLVSELRPVAAAIVSSWAEGADLPLNTADFFSAMRHYAAQSQQISSAELARRSGGLGSGFQSFKDKIDAEGWISLGAFYTQMASFNESAFESIDLEPSAKMPDIESIRVFSGKEMNTSLLRTQLFEKRIDVLTELETPGAGGGADVTDVAAAMAVSSIKSWLPFVGGDTQISAARYLGNLLSTGDPIFKFQQLGHSMVNAGSLLFSSALLAKGAMLISPAGRAGLLTAALDKAQESPINWAVAGVAIPIVVSLFFGGFFAAHYLPLLPFILWTLAVISWFMRSFEAIVAVTLWAAGHALPEGDGLAGQYGRQGYLVFLEILLMPALMVLAFFFATILTGIIGKLIGMGFLTLAQSSPALGDAPTGIIAQVLSWLAWFLIGSILVVVALHKVWGFVTWLPENLLRWVGGNVPSMGSHHEEAKVVGAATGSMTKIQATTEAVARSGPASGNANNRADNAGIAGSDSTLSPMKNPDNHSQGDVR